ncbi:hypothetical protein YQE_10609, partial [Dendroctonus ponderosae]
STADHKDFHTKSVENDTPFLYCLLSQPDGKPLSCPPAMRLVTTYRNGQAKRYLLRGDSEGSVLLWAIPDISTAQLEAIRAQAPSQPVTAAATLTTSLTKAWSSVRPDPVGALDQVERQERQSIKLTASIYLPLQSRLVVGREDGTIVIVPATQTVMLQLLHGNHQQYHSKAPAWVDFNNLFCLRPHARAKYLSYLIRGEPSLSHNGSAAQSPGIAGHPQPVPAY